MSNSKIDTLELTQLANELLSVRGQINTDTLTGLFSELSPLQYNVLKRLWPEISSTNTCPEDRITLQEIQEVTNLQMTYISQTIERIANAGLIVWERGESGTYVILSQHGFTKFKKQQEILLSYFERVLDRIGVDRFKQIVAAMKELENILDECAP